MQKYIIYSDLYDDDMTMYTGCKAMQSDCMAKLWRLMKVAMAYGCITSHCHVHVFSHLAMHPSMDDTELVIVHSELQANLSYLFLH